MTTAYEKYKRRKQELAGGSVSSSEETPFDRYKQARAVRLQAAAPPPQPTTYPDMANFQMAEQAIEKQKYTPPAPLPDTRSSQVEQDHQFRQKFIQNHSLLNPLGLYLRGVDALMYSGLGDWNERASQATNQTMFGSSLGKPMTTGSNLGDVTADTFGSVMGFMAPQGGGGALQLGEQAVAKAGGKLLPRLAAKYPNLPTSVVGKVAGKGLQGFGGGAAYGTTMGLVNGESPQDIAGNALREGLNFSALKGSSTMGRLPGALVGAGIFGGQALADGGTPQDALTQAFIGGLMGGMGGQGRTRKAPTFTETPAFEGEILPPLLRLGSGIKTGEGRVNPKFQLNARNPETVIVDGEIKPLGMAAPSRRQQPLYAGDAGISPDIEAAGRKLLPSGATPPLLPDRFVKGSPDYYASASGVVSRNPEIVGLYEQIRPSVSQAVEKTYVPGIKPAPEFIGKIIDHTAKVTPEQKAELVKLFVGQERPSQPLPKKQLPKNIGVTNYGGELKNYRELKTARDEMQTEINNAVDGEAGWRYDMQRELGANDLWKRIRENGGIKPYKDGYLAEEYKGLNSYVKNKGGLTMDEMADTLGYSSEADFLKDLHQQESASKETLANIRKDVDLYSDPRYKGMHETIDQFDKQMQGMEKNIAPGNLPKKEVRYGTLPLGKLGLKPVPKVEPEQSVIQLPGPKPTLLLEKPNINPTRTETAVKRVSTPEEWLESISKDDVDYRTAYNAHYATSFEPERRAKSEQDSYVKDMQKIYEKLSPLAKTPEQKALLVAELQRYREGYLKHNNAILAAKSRTASAMITGPANFPVARNQKALDVEHKRLVEFVEWEKKAVKAIEKKLKENTSPEVAKSENLQAIKKDIISTVSTLKDIENGAPYSKSLITNNLANRLKTQIKNGNIEEVKQAFEFMKELEAKHLSKSVFAKNNSIWQYADKVAEKIESAPTGQEAMSAYKGAEIIRNHEADRVQISFDGKPSPEVIQALKKEGWKWSPSNSVWQRKLTTNAEYSAKSIIDKYFEKAQAETAATSTLDQMEAAARERIAKSKGQLNANPVGVWADYAIVGAAKIARGLKDFKAWSAEMVKEFGKVIQQHLPALWSQAHQLHNRIRRTITTPPPAPNTAESFRAKVDRSPKDKGWSFKEIYNQLRTEFVDDLAPAERTEKGVTGKVASAEESLYKQARLFKGNAEKAHRIVKTKLGPIIDKAREKGYSPEDLGDYALAIHARDLHTKGINSGFTDTEISKVIRKFQSPEMESLRKELVKYSNDLLDNLAASGRISKQAVADMRAKHPNYVPFFRSFDDAKVEFESGVSSAIANAANPIKRIKGSDRMVIDPLENLIKSTFKMTAAADKTRVMGQLERLAKLDKAGDFVRLLKPGEDVGRKNVVKSFKDGKELQYEVQPDLYRSLKDLDKESADYLIKIMSKPASLLRAGATLTPEFSLRNPLRDVPHAFIVSKSGFNPLDFGVGLVGSVARGRTFKIMGREIKSPGELYNRFIMDNGGYGNIMSTDRKLQRQVLNDAIKNPVDRNFVTLLNPIRLLRAISDTTETATKVGEYRAALRSGASRQEAAYRARDIMDFARAGSNVRNLNRVVAFLNANIQGKSKTFRAVKEDPVGVATRAAISITLPTVGVFLAQKYLSNDKQKTMIDDAPAWMRSTFWLIPIPGTDQVARIPKPFEWSPVFANLPERLMEYLDKNDPEAFDGFVKETFAASSIPVLMTGLLPILEGGANYSWFREAPIIPLREQKLNYSDQYDINTTETAKFLAKGVNKLTGGQGPLKNFGSPRVMDNTIQGLTAGLGKLTTSAIDSLLEGAGIVKKPDKPTKSVSQWPITRAFLVNDMATGKALDNLYNENDRLSKAKASAKLNKAPFTDGRLLRSTASATERIGNISKRMRAIENNPNLDAETKRKMLEELNERRNEIARQTMGKFKKLR